MSTFDGDLATPQIDFHDRILYGSGKSTADGCFFVLVVRSKVVHLTILADDVCGTTALAEKIRDYCDLTIAGDMDACRLLLMEVVLGSLDLLAAVGPLPASPVATLDEVLAMEHLWLRTLVSPLGISIVDKHRDNCTLLGPADFPVQTRLWFNEPFDAGDDLDGIPIVSPARYHLLSLKDGYKRNGSLTVMTSRRPYGLVFWPANYVDCAARLKCAVAVHRELARNPHSPLSCWPRLEGVVLDLEGRVRGFLTEAFSTDLQLETALHAPIEFHKQWYQQIVSANVELGRLGFLWRSPRPENVLVEDWGLVRLADGEGVVDGNPGDLSALEELLGMNRGEFPLSDNPWVDVLGPETPYCHPAIFKTIEASARRRAWDFESERLPSPERPCIDVHKLLQGRQDEGEED